MKVLRIYMAIFLISSSALAQRIELVVPQYHLTSIHTLDLSGEPKFLLTGSVDNVIFLREASTGNYLRSFHEDDQLKLVRFLADGRSFLSLTGDGIVIRDMSARDIRQRIKGRFQSVIVSRSRNEFVAVGDSSLRIYQEVNHQFKLGKVIATRSRITVCAYSEDGKRLLFNDGHVRQLDIAKGTVLGLSLSGIDPDSIQSVAASKDNRTLFLGMSNGLIKIYDLKTNTIVNTYRLNRSFWSGQYGKGFVKDSTQVQFPVRKLFFTTSGDLVSYHSQDVPDDGLKNNTDSEFVNPDDLDKMWENLERELDGLKVEPTLLVSIWEKGTGRIKYQDKTADVYYPFAVANNRFATASGIRDYEADEKVDYETGKTRVEEVRFSEDGKKIAIHANESNWVWDLSTGKNFVVTQTLIRSDFNMHKNSLAVYSGRYNEFPCLFNLDKGVVDDTLDIRGYGIVLNPTKPQAASSYSYSLTVQDFLNQDILFRHPDTTRRKNFSFSKAGNFFLVDNEMWETAGYTFIDSVPGLEDFNAAHAIISRQHQSLLIHEDNAVVVRDYVGHVNLDTVVFYTGENNNILVRRKYHKTDDYETELPLLHILELKVTSDEKLLAVVLERGRIVLVDPVMFTIKTVVDTKSNLNYCDLSPDGKFMVTSAYDGAIRIWDLQSQQEVAKVLFYNKDWVVVSQSGLFDGSAGGLAKLFFINGLQTIELSQLKSRYYEPGLLKKIISGEPVRDVQGFNSVEMPPEIKVGQVDKQGNLPIEVINRGGGIGEVTLYINGKEVIRDLRQPGQSGKGSSMTFSVPVATQKSLVPGTENYISVKAWNGGQWIESRGTVVKYVPPTKKEVKPSIFIIACGVSDYTGDEIDLKYAAKDAEQIAGALELGAHRLFGSEKSHVYKLTSQRNASPTKANLLKAFEEISTTATSSDVLVVYLSGHGINLGGTDGDFHYLTQDAYTANPGAYNDPAIKKQTTLSSQELVDLFKKVPALKQVLIIDACASGKVVDNLMAKRDIESGTLRALDRLKDRTGMHIITGCTADAVSYEASRYGQGVLTYSLLEGLRGLALREDKFVDVSELFQFAQERVPVLASGIGGIQTPQVFSPNGSQSFDFGELTSEDKKLIPLATARPVYIRSTFIDEKKFRDVLGIGKKMDDWLNEISLRGESSPLLFTDVSEYPDGCQLSGTYNDAGGKITLKLNKTCGGKEELHLLEAKDEKELIERIVVLLK